MNKESDTVIGNTMKENEIPAEIQWLDDKIENLSKEIERLIERFNPVIHSMEKKLLPNTPNKPLVPLAEMIRNLRYKIETITEKIVDTRNGCEL